MNNIFGYKAFYKGVNGLYCEPMGVKCEYEEGGIYEVEGELKLCENGIHFCRELEQVFKFYPLTNWVEVHRVEILGDVIDDEEGRKSCTNKLKVLERVECENIENFCSSGIENSNNVAMSKAVTDSKNVSYGEGVSESIGVHNSRAVVECKAVLRSRGVFDSNGISVAEGVSYSRGVLRSHGVMSSKGVNDCNGLSGAEGASYCEGVYNSIGVECSSGIHYSIGVKGSRGIAYSMFVYNMNGGCNLFFNKQITAKRFWKIYEHFVELLGNWRPSYNNMKQLKEGSGNLWVNAPIQECDLLEQSNVWRDMPLYAIEFLMERRGFNRKIFKKITGIDVSKIIE